MPKYNLDALGSEEFERLCQSLALQVIGPGVKVYGVGKDGAREATFQGKASYPSKEERWGGLWIFQAKFHDTLQIGPKEARRRIIAELRDELSKIVDKYKHPCDNYILMTNVSLTPASQKGTKDRIDNEVIPLFCNRIKHIHVWGAEEICRFLDAYPSIRRTYAGLLVPGDAVARLLGMIDREETELDELVKLYCRGCFGNERRALLDDAGDIDDKEITLQQVFIDLDAKPQSLPQDTRTLERLPIWLRQAAEDENRTSALSYLLDDSIMGLVLKGGPGGGKSTLGQFIAQIQRARLLGRLSDLGKDLQDIEGCAARIPFRILLREYAQWLASRDEDDSLFHYIASQVTRVTGKETKCDHVHTLVKMNPILLILDGLDEVSEKKLRTRVLDNIASFVNQTRDVYNGNMRVMATTRPYGYSEEFDPMHYLHLTLQRLTSEKTILYAEKWTNARGLDPKETSRISTTLNKCLTDKVVSVLTQTPLQVTILLFIIRARGTPPKQREELFERYMDIIYQREQRNRPELLRTEQELIYGLHRFLAYILHKRAEKDETAALMDVSEFEKKVKEYLIHDNPLLRAEELETKTNQIITEASQRLVLIESPYEGKIGFGLAMTREFFAAAHLVDTAKGKQVDLRLRAISKSPHWRNVALFLAGRVGRNRPEDAPSMIDVCREIDTDAVDKFLKRGAELVMEMVDDRAIRVLYNEIGAVQYGLTLVEGGIPRKPEEFIAKLESLPEQYKERIVRPWLEDRLRSVVPENLEIYCRIFQKLYACDNPLKDALQRAMKSESRKVRLWALSMAIENKIVEEWVMKVLDELAEVLPAEELASALKHHWQNFKCYLAHCISSRAKATLALAMFEVLREPVLMSRLTYSSMKEGLLKYLTLEFDPSCEPRENHLYFWGISQLLLIYLQSVLEEGEYLRHDYLRIRWPAIVNPVTKITIQENARFLDEFCQNFSGDDEPITAFAVSLFKFLLDPSNFEKYVGVKQKIENVEMLATISTSIIGPYPEDAEQLSEHHKHLYSLLACYTNAEQIERDTEELTKIVTKESRKSKNHPPKLLAWARSGCDPAIEEFLDGAILAELLEWLQRHRLPPCLLGFCRLSLSFSYDHELFDFTLGVLEKRLKAKQRNVMVDPPFFAGYEWRRPMTKGDADRASRLKHVFERILSSDSPTIITPRQLEILYWSALGAEVIEEKHIRALYRKIHDYPSFPLLFWYPRAKSPLESLIRMLQSENADVERLAAVSLSSVMRRRHSLSDRMKMQEAWIGEKLWGLAKDKADKWQPRYVRGMAFCKLNWAKNSGEWSKAMKDADTEELQYAWSQVLRRGGFLGKKDRITFVNVLLHILQPKHGYEKAIKEAALERLYDIVSQAEPVGFDERPLGLPLAERPEMHL